MGALSPEEGFWGYLAALHFLDVPDEHPWSQEEWYRYPLRQAPGATPLDTLAGELCAEPGVGQCVSEALTRACTGVGEDAMLACLVALFQIGFVDARTRGRMLGDCTMGIVGICAKSVAQISNLVRLFACSYALVPATDSEGLFRALSFDGWEPDPALIREAQTWLVRDFAAAVAAGSGASSSSSSSSSSGSGNGGGHRESYNTFHTLGKVVFENAPWSTMSPTLNQYAAYLIVEVMMLLKNPEPSTIASVAVVKELSSTPRRARDEFMSWCWDMLLRFDYRIDPEPAIKESGIDNEHGEHGEHEEENPNANTNAEVEDIQGEVDDFVVVKKNKSSFKVLIPENENERSYLSEISYVTDLATIVNKQNTLSTFIHINN